MCSRSPSFSRLALAGLGLVLCACGGADHGDTNPLGPKRDASSSSASSSSPSSTGATGTAGACPSGYSGVTVVGDSAPDMDVVLISADRVATLKVRTPAAGLGTLRLCLGRADAAILPAQGAATLNYEVLADGAFQRLTASTLRFAYSAPGEVTVRYVAPPPNAAGRYGTAVDASGTVIATRTVRQRTVPSGEASHVVVLEAAQPGLYMTDNP
ncbi:MAG: hypothetical protein QM639_09060 [Rhodocyclaceae bacterium]